MSGLSVEEVQELKREIASSLFCALPGIVESFDAVNQTVCVQPAIKHKGADGEAVTLPLLRDVPVFFPGNKTAGITWPISQGDECLLIFADSAIDEWFETGEAEVPVSDRRHDLSDAFAFVGFRSRPNRLVSIPNEPAFFGHTFGE